MPNNPTIRRNTFLLLLAFVTILFVGLIADFLLACFWAAVLTIIFRNTFRRLRIKLKGRTNLAAALTTIMILLVVVLPLVIVTILLIQESGLLYEKFQSGELDPNIVINYIQLQLPTVQQYLEQFGMDVAKVKENLNNAALKVTQTVANQAFSYTQNAISFTVQFFLMLYMLFFFIRDGRQIMRAIVNVLPLGNKIEWTLFNRFASVAKATLKGTVIVAMTQGSIGGVLFWILGIEGAIFWGVVMTLLSLLPVGGSGIVWVPAAIILFIQGAVGKAIIMVAAGVLLIGLVDNFMRPLLVGRDTEMPDYLVLLATLGGIAWFGLSGFIIGPVIAALFLTCWEMMGENFGGMEK